MMNIDQDNLQQKYAFELIEKTRSSFFLTGRAGTGKTTFLKKLQESVTKNFLVLAPTGVAAINAGGQTIHSFFGFHLGVLGPGELGNMNGNKISIVRSVDAIIIDEVSMVRCDLVDAMDRTLRKLRHSSAPFGGVQMIFVGDPFQLEPVVSAEDRCILQAIYGNGPYYFYNSVVLSRCSLPKIEFQKIYRQKDKQFVDLLEHVRTNKLSKDDLMLINSRFRMEKKDSEPYSVVLTSTRAAAQKINETNLAKLGGEEFTYVASFEGDCKACRDCVEERLRLKVGAQVMLTKNDPVQRWVNGTIARVVSLSAEGITVALESGEEHNVLPATWENAVYQYDAKLKTTMSKVTGVATQYPLKLAWAITIHKSQSLTFDHVAVDFGRCAFAAGQAYVALSRATSLDGLVLLSPFSPSSIVVSDEVARFASEYNDEARIFTEIEVGEIMRPLSGESNPDVLSRSLFEQAMKNAADGKTELAGALLDKAMEAVADDACLMGEWPADTADARINAFGHFYSGDVPGTLEVLGDMGISVWSDFDCLYLLSRCYEEMGDWNKVEELYVDMIALYDELRGKGADSPSFRKFLYRLAILNEAHYGDPGAGIMRSLIAEMPGYEKYHLAIRPMLWKLKEASLAASSLFEGNSLVKMAMDSNVSDEEYRELLAGECRASTEQWRDYLKFLSKLELEMA